MKSVKRLIEALEFERDYAKSTCEKFAEKFADSPNYAFSWGMQAVEASGKLKAANFALTLLENGTSYSDVKAAITREVVNGARWPERSTSPISNLASECLVAGFANLLADMFGPEDIPLDHE